MPSVPTIFVCVICETTAPLHVAAWAFTHHSAPWIPTMARARGEERRVAQRHGPDDSSPQGGKHGVLQDGRRRGRACRPADTSRWGAAIAGGTAAHRGAHRGHRAVRADPRCACAAVGEPGGGPLAWDRRAGACRAGYRRAQDLSGQGPAALRLSSFTESWTVGGSADDRLLFFSAAAYRQADRWHSSFLWSRRSWWREEVYKVHAQNRIQQCLWSRTLTFQFLMVVVDGSVMEALKVSPKDRVLQRFSWSKSRWHSSSSGSWRLWRSSRLPPEFFWRFILALAWCRGLGFYWGSSYFSQIKKSVGLGPHSGSELGADFNPWTPAAYAVPMIPEEDESVTESESESEPEEDVETRFAGGFRPMRVCKRFLELHMGRPVPGCAYGDRCTFAHSWAELHREVSAHEHEFAS